MQRWLALTACAAALLCAGCMDYTEHIWLRADGSARIETVMATKDFADGLGGDGATPLGGDREFEDGSGKVWTERKDGQLLTHLEADIKDFRASGTLAPGDLARGKFSPDWYTVEPLGFGRYRLLRTIAFPGAEEAAPAGGGDSLGEMGNAFGKSILAQMMEGHEFSVTLHAPFILSSNADVQEGNTATWKREMSEIAGGGAEPFTIEATVLLLDYRLLAAVGGGLLLLIVIIVLAARRRPKRAASAGPSSVDPPV